MLKQSRKLPTTLTEAIDYLVEELQLQPEYTDTVKKTEAIDFHHGYGTSIRNSLNLWDKKSPLNIWFQTHLGLAHGDDLSGIIMQMVWAKIKDKYFDPFKEAEKYHEHWKNMGVDPLRA